MKFTAFFSVLLILCFSPTVAGQEAKLEGYLFDDKDKPVPKVRIVAAGGQAAETDNIGHFTIRFPTSVHPGQATTIAVLKSNWVIFQPMFGNCVTQSSGRNYEPLRVMIVPRGSPLALSPKRLSQVIAKWSAERVTLQVEVGMLKQDLDQYAFLRQYAKEYGFTLERLHDAVEQWAKIKESDDKEERALKEYWQKHYQSAAQLAEESAQAADEELKQAHKKTIEASRKIIRRYKLAGNSYFAQDKFREALTAYTEIRKRFDTKELPKQNFLTEIAEIGLLIGNAKVALGERVAGEEGPRLLKDALNEYQNIAASNSRQQLPLQWAATQNSLGVVLTRMGVRIGGTDSIKYLKDAIAAFRAALEIRTIEQFPQEWATTQNQLGIALSSLGERVGGTESINYLKDAITACRASLRVFNRAHSPHQWAASQNGLGLVLSSLGARVNAKESIQYFKDSVAAYHAALEVRTQTPREKGLILNNLGGVLWNLGVRVSASESVQFLKDSIAAFRGSLEINTREQSPQDWAATQGNLSNVLSSLAERVNGDESIVYLKEAVEACRAALEVNTREQQPQQWGVTQNNLGNALWNLGRRTNGPESINYLRGAVTAYRAAIEVRTPEQLPQKWALTQNNLCTVLYSLSSRVDRAETVTYLEDAATACRAALEVFTRDQLPQYWATVQYNLGNALSRLGAQTNGTESAKHLNDAIVAYRHALEVKTAEHFPQDWALTQKGLARAYSRLRDWGNEAEVYKKILVVDPENRDAYGDAAFLYQDKLFKFDLALLLRQQWLARHPEDLLAQADFAEALFSVGRFVECGQRIQVLLSKPEVPIETKTALRAIEIANLLAVSKHGEVQGKLDTMIENIARQPAEFKVSWVFEGTKHFIQLYKGLSAHRDWLRQMFDALTRQDRDTSLEALQEVRKNFKEKS